MKAVQATGNPAEVAAAAERVRARMQSVGDALEVQRTQSGLASRTVPAVDSVATRGVNAADATAARGAAASTPESLPVKSRPVESTVGTSPASVAEGTPSPAAGSAAANTPTPPGATNAATPPTATPRSLAARALDTAQSIPRGLQTLANNIGDRLLPGGARRAAAREAALEARVAAATEIGVRRGDEYARGATTNAERNAAYARGVQEGEALAQQIRNGERLARADTQAIEELLRTQGGALGDAFRNVTARNAPMEAARVATEFRKNIDSLKSKLEERSPGTNLYERMRNEEPLTPKDQAIANNTLFEHGLTNEAITDLERIFNQRSLPDVIGDIERAFNAVESRYGLAERGKGLLG